MQLLAYLFILLLTWNLNALVMPCIQNVICIHIPFFTMLWGKIITLSIFLGWCWCICNTFLCFISYYLCASPSVIMCFVRCLYLWTYEWCNNNKNLPLELESLFYPIFKGWVQQLTLFFFRKVLTPEKCEKKIQRKKDILCRTGPLLLQLVKP